MNGSVKLLDIMKDGRKTIRMSAIGIIIFFEFMGRNIGYCIILAFYTLSLSLPTGREGSGLY
jgi:hypothetical protein